MLVQPSTVKSLSSTLLLSWTHHYNDFFDPNRDIVDIKLPDMTGIELIEKLSQLSRKMKYIIITGNASLESAIEAVKQNKIVSYTLKPLDMNYFIPLLQQIIERKHAEEALFKVEQEKKSILNSISEPVAYQDRDHKLVWINSAAKDSAGMPYDKIIGRRCYDALAHRSEPCTGCPSEKIIETGRPHTGPETSEHRAQEPAAWQIKG